MAPCPECLLKPEEAFFLRRIIPLVTIVATLISCAGAPAVTVPPATATLTDTAFPVAFETAAGTVEIAMRPERIVSLSASATEALFAIGAGSQVVATDSFSYFPEEAPTQADLLAIEPNVEAIVNAFAPDLVILAFDPGSVVDAFGVLGVPVVVHGAPASFDDAYAQWEQLGAATGHLAEAVALINRTQDTINEVVAATGDAGVGVTFYHELDPTLYSVTSATFLGAVFDRFGLTNIADAADPDGWGYPQLSPEYLIDQGPELIFFTSCCGDDVDSLSARPGWATIPAVQNGRVFELDDDHASRWGPRIADLATAISQAILTAALVDA